MSNKTIENIPTLYESYFLRDLTYTLSGLISIFSISLLFEGSTASLLETIEDHVALFFAFLALSYVIGLLLQEGLSAIGQFKVKPDIPQPYATHHALMSEIREKCGPLAIRELERTIYIKHVGSGIGSASLIAAVFIIIAGCLRSLSFLIGIAFSTPVFIISLYLNRSKLREQNQALNEFAKN